MWLRFDAIIIPKTNMTELMHILLDRNDWPQDDIEWYGGETLAP